jgi:hypothetical protein
MRKLIVLSFITLDGVMQAPGGPEEDPAGGFKEGGRSLSDNRRKRSVQEYQDSV